MCTAVVSLRINASALPRLKLLCFTYNLCTRTLYVKVRVHIREHAYAGFTFFFFFGVCDVSQLLNTW